MSFLKFKDMTYEIIEKIGEGGSGTVFKGIKWGSYGFSKPVAIKVLKKKTPDNTSKTLLNHAFLISHLNHPNIVEVYELIKNKNEVMMIMEWVDGISLQDIMNTYTQGIPLPCALFLFCELLKVLDYLHNLEHNQKIFSLIHHDISPLNIMIQRRTGIIKLNDFGISRIVTQGQTHPVDKTIICNPFYCSPEYISGESVGIQSDIYSLGRVFFEMIFGHHTTANVIDKAKRGQLSDFRKLKTLPTHIENLLLGMLQYSPKNRFNSAKEILDFLDGDAQNLLLWKQEFTSIIEPIFHKPKISSLSKTQTSITLSQRKNPSHWVKFLVIVFGLSSDPSLLLRRNDKEFYYELLPQQLNQDQTFLWYPLHIKIVPWGFVTITQNHKDILKQKSLRQESLWLPPGQFEMTVFHPILGRKQKSFEIEKNRNITFDFDPKDKNRL